MNSTSTLAGHLLLRPGHAEPISCDRPMIGAAMMRRLTEGRRASLLPDLVGTVFTLCAQAQRGNARRAVWAALGHDDKPAARWRDQLTLRLFTAREHLQRLALDLPQQLPTAAIDPSWLRDAPVFALPARVDGPDESHLQQADAALAGWLERRVLGMPPAEWLQHWHRDPEAWLSTWSAGSTSPLAPWWRALRGDAVAVTLPCRPLALLDGGETALKDIAAALAADDHFAERPLWQGAAAETGPWTRQGRSWAAAAAATLWWRLGARLADLVHIALGGSLACGALRLQAGEAIAWCEMSRGLLLHWVRLSDAAAGADVARVQSFRVLAPTEWNFHPQGSLADALRDGALAGSHAVLAAAALDPCIRYELHNEAEHA
jgi:hypothetical protein